MRNKTGKRGQARTLCCQDNGEWPRSLNRQAISFFFKVALVAMWKVVEGNHMRGRETNWKYFIVF